jgi:uracil phosphoribosyltransferase
MNKIVLHATDLDGFLLEDDKNAIEKVRTMYETSLENCAIIDKSTDESELTEAKANLVKSASQIGAYLKEFCSKEPNIHVYSFETPKEQHGQASRLIAKLRQPSTSHEEFLYYIQRAYEMMFAHVYCDAALPNKRSLITATPVTNPVRNYAAHKIPNIDPTVENSVMCVMLRGALLPSCLIYTKTSPRELTTTPMT